MVIVDDVVGVICDCMMVVIEEEGIFVEIIDMGGIGINDVDDFDDEID